MSINRIHTAVRVLVKKTAEQIRTFHDESGGDKTKRKLRPIGIRTDVAWTGGELPAINTQTFRVFQCPSSLSLRSALAASTAEGSPTPVLLTPLDEGDLDADVLARLESRKLLTLDPWRLALAALSCERVHPSLTEGELNAWLPERLLDAIDPANPPRPSGQFLGADFAWSLLLNAMLGLKADQPQDLPTLMAWFQTAEAPGRWAALDEPERVGVRSRLVATSGPAAAVALGTWLNKVTEPAVRPLAAGLLLDALDRGPAISDHDTMRKVLRLDGRLGLDEDAQRHKQPWAAAARAVLVGLDRAEQRRALAEADALAAHFDLTHAASGSDWLPSALDARITAFAGALESAVAQPQPAPSTQLFELAAAVSQHRLAVEREQTTARIDHALALLRWMTLDVPPDTAGSLASLARRFATVDSFVDAARSGLRGGETHPGLSRALAELGAAAVQRRESFNRKFAEALAGHHGGGGSGGALSELGVVEAERFLDEVVTPLAADRRVLVVVMDGMTLELARRLARDLVREDWREVALPGRDQRVLGLSPVPSVTRLARATLLSGRRAVGGQDVERSNFAAHPALAALPGGPPTLLHKADLADPGDHLGLADSARKLVENTRKRVVGVVVNAIDDQLSGSVQLAVDWGLKSVPVLQALLTHAREGDRLVVLTSDHGHCPEWGTTASAAGDAPHGERWRSAAELAEGELAMTGPRVGFPGEANDGKVVVPWSEGMRYVSGKSAGYHGGVSPQEIVTPIVVLDARSEDGGGLAELPSDVPLWFIDPRLDDKPIASPAPAVAPAAKQEPRNLFTDPETPVAKTEPAVPLAGWVTDLLAGEVYANQKEMVGDRYAPPDAEVGAWLTEIDGLGGSVTLAAIATRLKLSPGRAKSRSAGLQRLLNVEGYAVLSMDNASQTLVLNKPLLMTQFELRA